MQNNAIQQIIDKVDKIAKQVKNDYKDTIWMLVIYAAQISYVELQQIVHKIKSSLLIAHWHQLEKILYEVNLISATDDNLQTSLLCKIISISNSPLNIADLEQALLFDHNQESLEYFVSEVCLQEFYSNTKLTDNEKKWLLYYCMRTHGGHFLRWLDKYWGREKNINCLLALKQWHSILEKNQGLMLYYQKFLNNEIQGLGLVNKLFFTLPHSGWRGYPGVKINLLNRFALPIMEPYEDIPQDLIVELILNESRWIASHEKYFVDIVTKLEQQLQQYNYATQQSLQAILIDKFFWLAQDYCDNSANLFYLLINGLAGAKQEGGISEKSSLITSYKVVSQTFNELCN